MLFAIIYTLDWFNFNKEENSKGEWKKVYDSFGQDKLKRRAKSGQNTKKMKP